MNNERMLCDYRDTGDIVVRNQIVENNIPLVKHIASKFYSSSCCRHEYDDLVSFGIFGLIRAVEIYDLSKNVKFSTFAYQKIYYSIIDELRKEDSVPRSIRQKIQLVKKDLEYMETRCGYDVDVQQVARSHGLSPTDIYVLEDTYILSAEPILKYIYDKRSLHHDNVLCRPTFRTSPLSQTVYQ